MSVKKTALTAALCSVSFAAFSQVYVIEPQNYSIPQGPDAQITTGATISPDQIDMPVPNIPPPPQVPPSMTTIYSSFSDTPQPVQQSANGPSQRVGPLYENSPPPKTSVYSNYPELPYVTQQSAYSTPEGSSPPQQPYAAPPKNSVYSNYSDLPYIMQKSTNGSSQQVSPPYGNLPYAAPPVQPQSLKPDSLPIQYQPPPIPAPPPVQYQQPVPYPEPSVQFQPPVPPQFSQQQPSPVQQLYAPPTTEFLRDFPVPDSAYAPDHAYTNKTYRLQVGAFKAIINAQYLYDAVSATGLSPAIENTGDLYRVVIPYVQEAYVTECVELLRRAGFSVWVREE
jgi:hypothetical protein